ncbi:hypothetical protein D3C76_1756290 [compost metagenome]
MELGIRAAGDKRFLFVLNYSGEPAPVQLRTALKDLLSGAVLEQDTVLPPYGVWILELPEVGK